MFVHNFKYALKTLLKNKSLIFWTFAFPLILATFFYMAFSNINDSEKISIINIAIVDNDEFKNSEIFKTAFEELSNPTNEERLFNTTYTTQQEATNLLEKEEIIGYLIIENNEPNLIFATSGINQMILKYVTEEIIGMSTIIKNIAEEQIKKETETENTAINYEEIYKNVSEMTKEDVKLTNIANSNLDYAMIEFYTLIAMTCMYGGILGMVAMNQNLANMSNKGKRVSISPTKKSTMIMSSLLASYIAQLIGLLLLFIYTIFVLNVNYGENIGLVILLSIAGSFAGLSLGIIISTTLKKNENTKTGILLAFTMFGCFLSGMFGVTMKYIVDKNLPILNKINPVNMITDGLYSLYYYDTLNRYWLNIASLFLFSFICIGIAFVGLRRQKYDSI